MRADETRQVAEDTLTGRSQYPEIQRNVFQCGHRREVSGGTKPLRTRTPSMALDPLARRSNCFKPFKESTCTSPEILLAIKHPTSLQYYGIPFNGLRHLVAHLYVCFGLLEWSHKQMEIFDHISEDLSTNLEQRIQ
jgi:hypothetical protein